MHPLRRYRQSQSPALTQTALAAILGVTVSTVSRWEAGVRKVDADLLPTLTERTGVSARDLRPDLAAIFGCA